MVTYKLALATKNIANKRNMTMEIKVIINNLPAGTLNMNSFLSLWKCKSIVILFAIFNAFTSSVPMNQA